MDEQKPGNVISPNSQIPPQPPQEVASNLQQTLSGQQDAARFAPEQLPTLTNAASSIGEPSRVGSAAYSVPPSDNNSLTSSIDVDNMVTPITTTESSDNNGHVTWTASEFIEHAKSVNWYLVVGIVGALGSVGVYFWTKDTISTLTIAVVAILFGVSAARKPRVLPYSIDELGIQIAEKRYPYSEFKTFSLVQDNSAFSSIHLLPLKRFAPPVTMYFPPDEEDAIANALSMYLPYEERKADATDRLLKKLRF